MHFPNTNNLSSESFWLVADIYDPLQRCSSRGEACLLQYLRSFSGFYLVYFHLHWLRVLRVSLHFSVSYCANGPLIDLFMSGFSTQVQRPSISMLVSATQSISAKPSHHLSTAASLSNLSFRKDEECTSSVSSLLATASFSTICSESIVGGNNDGSQLFSSCINYTVIPEASTTVQITADPFAEFCCGPCAIIYPQASILHWPVQRTNTWCDKIQSSLRVYKSAAIGDENNPQPILDPTFFQNAMGLDPEIGGDDALDNDGNIRAPYTRPPDDGTYAVAKNGFVLSVYLFPFIKGVC